MTLHGKLEDQVCSVELSKKLKELGIQPKNYFEWLYDSYTGQWEVSPTFKNQLGLSAFTVVELLSLLPNIIDTRMNEPFNNFRLSIEKFIIHEGVDYFPLDAYKIAYYCDSTDLTGEDAFLRRSLTSTIYDKNPANALAKMLIYLIENNLMKLAE